MECRPCWYVQSHDDGLFLAPDNEGGVIYVHFLANAVPFENEEAAFNAVIDHFDGHGSVIQAWKPLDLD
jgi:hypothetical protein